MKILSYRQCQEAKLPVTPPLTDDERIAQAQDRFTLSQVVDKVTKDMPKITRYGALEYLRNLVMELFEQRIISLKPAQVALTNGIGSRQEKMA